MTIEKLKAGEGERLSAIRLRALSSDPDAFGTTYEEGLSFSFTNWNEQVVNLPTFIAATKGVDAGMVRIGNDFDDPRFAWLISLWVAPEARGGGLGEKLIEALLKECLELGRLKVKLDVADTNPSAIKLYERMGFIRNGEVGALAPPRNHITEFQMEKKLT